MRSNTAGSGATSAAAVFVEAVADQNGACRTDSLKERQALFRLGVQSTSSTL
jgi:hypothetical protein